MRAAGGARRRKGGRAVPLEEDGGAGGAPRGAMRRQRPARRPGRLLRRCQASGGPDSGSERPRETLTAFLPLRFLLCASGDFVKMYSVATEELVRLLRGHGDLVTSVQLAPHNHLQVGRAGSGVALGRGAVPGRAGPPAAAGRAAVRAGALCDGGSELFVFCVCGGSAASNLSALIGASARSGDLM